MPIGSIAGRALVTVIAIMTFLGALAAGSAILIARASGDWRSAVSREMTIQVRPLTGRDVDAEVAKAVGCAVILLNLAGGVIGGVCAALVFAGAGVLQASLADTAGGDQLQALFGSFTLGVPGYLAIAAIAGGVALATGFTSRTVVFRHLQALE